MSTTRTCDTSAPYMQGASKVTRRLRDRLAKEIEERIRVLRDALQEALASGVSSASISGAGNSQSYTRVSVADLRAEITRLERERFVVQTSNVYRRTSPDFEA